MAKFSLNWSAPSNDGNSPVTDYIIQYREVGSPNWLTYSDSISNSNSLIIDNITQCLNYEFRIAAKNATGISSFSNPVSDVLGFIPSGVSNIVLSDSVVVTDITLNISWSAPSNNDGCTITDYIIEYSNNGGNTWNRIADGISDTTNYSITNLSVGTYIVRIAAVNVVGSGSFVQSGPITITTTPPPGVMSIAQQPAHYKTIGYGENGTFSTQAVSSNGQPPQYQWQTVVFELIDVEPYIRPRWVDIPNANSSTLSISIETLQNFYYNYYEEGIVLNYGFYPGCVRCATTAISCNTAYTEYAILFNFSSFFSTGGVFQDFEDNSYEFIDPVVEVINGTTYYGWYVPQFEVLGIYQSAYRYDFDESYIFGGLTFVPEGTTLGYIYTQKSTDAINWQNVGDTPVNILRTNVNLDAGSVTNFGFTTSTVEYYKSFIIDNWPLPFINILGGDNVISSIYSNQQSEIVFDDMLNRLKIYWEEQQTLCVTNTELSTFPGSISFNRTYTGYKPLIKSEEYPNRLSLQYRPNEGIWYLSDSNTPVFYTSASSDLLGTWNDSQSDGFPPIIVSGICPTTTTTTTTTTTLAPSSFGYIITGAGDSTSTNTSVEPNQTYCFGGVLNGKNYYISSDSSFITYYIYWSDVWVIGTSLGLTPNPSLPPSSFPQYLNIRYINNTATDDNPPLSGWITGFASYGISPAPSLKINIGIIITGTLYVDGQYCYKNRCHPTDAHSNYDAGCGPKAVLTNNNQFMPIYIYKNQTLNIWEIGNGYGVYFYNNNQASDAPLTGWIAGPLSVTGEVPTLTISTSCCS